MKIRSFVAIELPSSIQDSIIRQTTSLRVLYPNPAIRWVKAGNIHLTLKFLGDLTQTKLDLLAQSLAFEASRIEPFSLSFSSLGLFPNNRKPRMIWIRTITPPILVEFQSKIETLTSKLVIQIEKRPFSPHITLGRIGNNKSINNINNLIKDIDSTVVSDIESINISAIKIFQSDLKPDGPIYTSVRNIPFGISNNKRGKI